MDGVLHAAAPRQYEALFYRSHQEHRVTPLERGTRVALALEWWHEQGVDLKGSGGRPTPKDSAGACPK